MIPLPENLLRPDDPQHILVCQQLRAPQNPDENRHEDHLLARHRQLYGKEAGDACQSLAGKRGDAFTYKVFPNMGHGTLAGEHPQAFSEEVQAVQRMNMKKEEKR